MEDVKSINELKKLEEQIAQLEQKRKEVYDDLRSHKLAEIVEHIKTFNFNAKELGLVTVPNKPTPTVEPVMGAVYVDPAKPDKTWTPGGRGPKPKFLKDEIEKGGDISRFIQK